MSPTITPISDFYKIILLEKYKLLYTEWLRAVSSEEYRAALLEAYKCIRLHQLELWVMDSTRNNPTVQDQKWSVEKLGSLMAGTLIRKVAMVRADDLFVEVVAEVMRDKIYKLYGQERQLEHFRTLEEALQYVLPGEDPAKLVIELQNAEAYTGYPAD
ncbi:hypothetical protein [Pontibacter ruber]|uniref:Uncharacterized protein n=1 Tax=Pontibacter ruber TaxID=1343895 RepID=A0ABW5CZ76_9BACT|nr:hypothetical protein [Pontibacter ruber]